MNRSAPAVRTESLTFRYPGGGAGIEGIDFEVRAGETVALLGPNGSGKTTLLRLLADDLRPGSGAIHHRPDDRQRSPGGRIGYASDVSIHFDELTGRENAHWFVVAAGGQPPEADALLDRFGLSADADRKIGGYSFGMRRKVMLVEALAHEPGLLLLDEPTVGLDPAGMRTLGELLTERTAAGVAVVLATNDTRIAMRADRVLFLYRGRVVADDSPAALLASVRGRTRIEIELEAMPEGTLTLPAGASAAETRTGLVVEVSDAGADLPAVCDAVVRAGGRIRRIDVREPGFDEVFRHLTGESLRGDADGEPEQPPAAASAPAGATRRRPPWRRR